MVEAQPELEARMTLPQSSLMSPRLLEILQHALGVDQYGRGKQYRNHFVAGPVDALKCDELVALGYMAKSSRRGFEGDELTGGMPCYFVTDEGRLEMIRQSPKPPRARQSRVFECWRNYCDACGEFPFSRFWKEVWPNYEFK